MTKRLVEVFSADCPLCKDAIELVRKLACDRCEVRVVNLNDPEGASRARSVGVRSTPAVAVDGTLAACCAGRGIDESALRAAGVGQCKP
jgi:hypothetical protein